MTRLGVKELARGAAEVLPAGELERKLALGRPLRVKLGIDPTAPDIHLGHTVVLHKLRDFQDAGHLVVLIIGDFTARIGDPSGRSEVRPMLTVEQIEAHAQTYQEQAFKVLDDDPARLELRRNSEWLDMSMSDLLALVRTTTVGQVLERDDFAKRRARGEPVSVLELLYPLMQGYDSVAVSADIELGGTDQTFNLLLGRDIQRAYGQPEQAVLTMPLLLGIDGREKMSKSLGNQIGVADDPSEIYGRTMSIPDSALEQWYQLLLGRTLPAGSDPLEAKRALARELTTIYHGSAAAEHVAGEWDRVQRAGGTPSEIEDATFMATNGTVHLPALIAELFDLSRSQARRLISQGAVTIDDVAVADVDVAPEALDGRVLRVGKRRFKRLARAAG
jgi:tyrosyl-tRNA synthetase